jgi:hypothetical protein
MALNKTDLIKLAKTVANANPSSPVAYSFEGNSFSYADLNETLRNELNEISSSYQLYRENKNTLFALIEQVIDDVLPKKVNQAYGQFAEVRTFAQGDKPVFVQKITEASRRRARQFITKVGLAGVYEVFKLDGRNYEVPTSAFGGAAQIGLEEFLDGRVDFAEVLNIVMNGLDECVYIEIERALIGAVSQLQEANKFSGTGFIEAEMDRLISIADAYGNATIYCTYEFAATMVPAEGWVSDRMKDELWNTGYIANYKGHRVIVLPQSYEDETNTKKVIDPSYAWIIPTGGNDKPVKVAFEGQTLVDERKNADWSREVQVYKKLGVAAIITNNICVYRNEALAPEESV